MEMPMAMYLQQWLSWSCLRLCYTYRPVLESVNTPATCFWRLWDVLGTTNVPATCLWRFFTCTRNNKCPRYLSLKVLHMYSGHQMSQLPVYITNCCFNSSAGQSHKDSVRKATVEEKLCSKTIPPAMKAQLHLPALRLSLGSEPTT